MSLRWRFPNYGSRGTCQANFFIVGYCVHKTEKQAARAEERLRVPCRLPLPCPATGSENFLSLLTEKSAPQQGFPKTFGLLCEVKLWPVFSDEGGLKFNGLCRWRSDHGDFNF